jgi:hypothetical protein
MTYYTGTKARKPKAASGEMSMRVLTRATLMQCTPVGLALV